MVTSKQLRVTAVVSARNTDLARSLGADQTIDNTRHDFTRDHGQYHLVLGPALCYRETQHASAKVAISPVWHVSRPGLDTRGCVSNSLRYGFIT